jgi:hypothetical protein
VFGTWEADTANLEIKPAVHIAERHPPVLPIVSPSPESHADIAGSVIPLSLAVKQILPGRYRIKGRIRGKPFRIGVFGRHQAVYPFFQ